MCCSWNGADERLPKQLVCSQRLWLLTCASLQAPWWFAQACPPTRAVHTCEDNRLSGNLHRSPPAGTKVTSAGLLNSCSGDSFAKDKEECLRNV